MPLPPMPIPTPRPQPGPNPVPRPANPPAAAVLHALAAATDRLLATVDGMTAEECAEPSLLPGWTRAHVLAHLALNAKGLASVLTTLESGNPIPMYASDRRRDSDIEHLAAEPAARLADRVAVGASMLAQHLGGGPTPEQALETVGAAGQLSGDLARAREFAAGPAAAGLPGGDAHAGDAARPGEARRVIPAFETAARESAAGLAAWSMVGPFERTPGGKRMEAADIPTMRWREVEIHHADLGLGYVPAEWPAEFAEYLLALAAFDRDGEASMAIVPDGGAPITLSGPEGAAAGIEISGATGDLAWWLVGRGAGESLAVADGTLPVLGPWRRR